MSLEKFSVGRDEYDIYDYVLDYRNMLSGKLKFLQSDEELLKLNYKNIDTQFQLKVDDFIYKVFENIKDMTMENYQYLDKFYNEVALFINYFLDGEISSFSNINVDDILILKNSMSRKSLFKKYIIYIFDHYFKLIKENKKIIISKEEYNFLKYLVEFSYQKEK